ncbi:MAG TPA: hypothetical protein VK524_32975 [Polyangiaceae bacterium]|nr:hypothetical protein [Polyangiaceae bacterium]
MCHTKRIFAAVILGTAVCGGCGSGPGRDDYPDPIDYGQPETIYAFPPAECMPSPEIWRSMQGLHDDTEASVHELIKCGGLQTSVSRTFLIVVLASNRDLFDADAYAELVRFARGFGIDLQIPFERAPGGRWTMALNGQDDSSFSLWFRDPSSGAIIEEDPFLIDTYVSGVSADPEMTIDEMEAQLSQRNTIWFSWQEPGPLVHVLADGRPVPNPFAIEVSFADLGEWAFGFDFTAGDPNFGPLDSILDLDIESEVVLKDQRGITTIEYEVVGLASTLREVSESGVAFGVKHIAAQRGAFQLTGSASDLRYDASLGGLAGEFQYRITGPGGDLLVTDTYGTGNGLEVRWSCPK